MSMTEFHVEVVQLGDVRKHPNADTLSITDIHGGYPVIFRTGEFQQGGLAVYVPIDAIVPVPEDPRWEFLGRHKRITAKKLRGVFSMGLLTPADPAWKVGQDVAAELNIEKWEPPLLGPSGGHRVKGIDPDAEHDPKFMPVYDIEGYRRYKSVLEVGEEVVITEKLHGASARFAFHDDKFWIGSRSTMKKADANTIWNIVAREYRLAGRLVNHPGVGLYGEVYGWVQDLRYGHSQNRFSFAVFDVLDIKTGKFWDFTAARDFVTGTLDLPFVPILYHGPWDPEKCVPLAEGTSTICEGLPGLPHVREGIVIKPTTERWNQSLGRVILKLHGEGYMLRSAKQAVESATSAAVGG